MRKSLTTTINYGGAVYTSLLLVSPRRNRYEFVPGSKAVGLPLGETVQIADGITATKYYQSRSGLSGAARIEYDPDYVAYPIGWTRPNCREQQPQILSIKGGLFWVYAVIEKWDEVPNGLIVTNSHDVWRMHVYQLAEIFMGADIPEPVKTKTVNFITLDGASIEIDLPKDKQYWRYTRHFSPAHSQYNLAVIETDQFREKFSIIFQSGRWAVCARMWDEAGKYLVLDRNTNLFTPYMYDTPDDAINAVPGWWVQDVFIAVHKGNEIRLWCRGESYEVAISEKMSDACDRFRKELGLPEFFSEENMESLLTGGDSSCVVGEVEEEDLMDIINNIENNLKSVAF